VEETVGRKNNRGFLAGAFSRTPQQSDTPVEVADKDAEIKALKERIERLEAEKDILKKAAAYFAKELD